MDFKEEMRILKRDLEIVQSYTISNGVGLETINIEAFYKSLKGLVSKSAIMLKRWVLDYNVQVNYTPKNTFDLKKKVLQVPFTKGAPTLIFVPLDFNGKVSEFTSLLSEYKNDVKNVDKALHDANTLFSHYISSPNSLNKLDSKVIPKLPKLDNLPKDFRKFFQGKEGIDRMELGEAYQSYSDFNQVSEDLDSLTREFSELKLNIVKERVEDLYGTLEMLISVIEKNNIAISKPVARDISTLIYSLADWLAMFALYITKLVAVVNSHKDTTKKLNGFF